MGYEQVLLRGEIGTVAGMRLIEDNFATAYVYDPDARTATSKASNSTGRDFPASGMNQTAIWQSNANGADAYFFGSPTVREAIVIPEEIRRKEITDYGRSKGIAWYWLGGFQLEWGESQAQEGNARIIHYSSL